MSLAAAVLAGSDCAGTNAMWVVFGGAAMRGLGLRLGSEDSRTHDRMNVIY